jgi:hypothetical protein
MSAEQSQFNFDQPEPIDRIQEKFEVWLKRRRHIYDELVRLAREAKGEGKGRYSVEALYVIYRWHNPERKEEGEEFKVNDKFTSRIARKIMAENPDLAGFFTLRPLRVERKGKRAA